MVLLRIRLNKITDVKQPNAWQIVGIQWIFRAVMIIPTLVSFHWALLLIAPKTAKGSGRGHGVLRPDIGRSWHRYHEITYTVKLIWNMDLSPKRDSIIFIPQKCRLGHAPQCPKMPLCNTHGTFPHLLSTVRWETNYFKIQAQTYRYNSSKSGYYLDENLRVSYIRILLSLLFGVELCPPKRYFEVLTLLIWPYLEQSHLIS